MPMRIHAIEKVVENTPIHKTFYFSDEDCRNAEPGQFVMVWIPGVDEVPMSLSFIGKQQAVTVEAKGEGTKKMHEMKEGDKIGVRGPYGKGFSISKGKKLFIAGGTGIVILGARSSSLLLFEEELKSMGVELHISTDDGSKGHKGFVTDLLEEIAGNANKKFDMVKSNIPMEASLERYMKCGIGICGSCAIDGYLVCRDGPVFGSNILSKMDDFGKWKRDETGKKVEI